MMTILTLLPYPLPRHSSSGEQCRCTSPADLRSPVNWYPCGRFLSGTTIRDTLTQGPNRPQNAIRPTVPTTLPGSTTTASLDLPSSSDPNGKKDYSTAPTLLQRPKSFPRPEKAQSSLGSQPSSAVRPIRGHPSNPRSDLRLARGLPAETLDSTPHLRLARG